MGVEITLFRSTNAQRLESWCLQGNLRSPTLNVGFREYRRAPWMAGVGAKRTFAGVGVLLRLGGAADISSECMEGQRRFQPSAQWYLQRRLLFSVTLRSR